MNTPTPNKATAPAFVGWWRPDRRTPFTRLVQAGSYDEAMSMLLDALEAVHGGDFVVVRANVDPNRPARPWHAGGRRRL